MSGGYELVFAEGERLDQVQQVVEATLGGTALVARIELSSDTYEATIDHPVKTMNANERDGFYQTDTGPLLFPDLSASPDALLEGLELAFAAFNSPDWVEFIVRVPTALEEGIEVYHYSKSVRVESRNSIVALN